MTSAPIATPKADQLGDARASVAKALCGASVKWVAAIGGILAAAGIAGFGSAMATVGVGAVCVIAALTIWGVSRIG